MPATITCIRQTKLGRYSLHCEQGFLFSVDSEIYFRSGVAEGDTLTDAQLDDLQHRSDDRKAKDKALQYLSARLYGEQELYRKLCLKFDRETSARAVAEMVRLELLDDEQFARQKAAWLKGQHKSRREAERRLAEKGVERDIAAAVLDEVYADADEREEIDRLLERSYGAKLAAGKRDAVYAALCRRGFAPRTVREAIADWLESGFDADDGWESC